MFTLVSINWLLMSVHWPMLYYWHQLSGYCLWNGAGSDSLLLQNRYYSIHLNFYFNWTQLYIVCYAFYFLCAIVIFLKLENTFKNINILICHNNINHLAVLGSVIVLKYVVFSFQSGEIEEFHACLLWAERDCEIFLAWFQIFSSHR